MDDLEKSFSIERETSEDPRILECIKLKNILVEVGKEFGFIVNPNTNAAWTAIARATRILDDILDQQTTEHPSEEFYLAMDFILGFSRELSAKIENPLARAELVSDAEVIIENLPLEQRQAVRNVGEKIQKFDIRIKESKTPKSLARWRKAEGALTAMLFLEAVPYPERIKCDRFSEFVNYSQKFFAFGNLMDSLKDLEEDSGVTHQVEDSRINRAVLTFRSIGSLAAVLAQRGPIRNPIKAGNILMAEPS